MTWNKRTEEDPKGRAASQPLAPVVAQPQDPPSSPRAPQGTPAQSFRPDSPRSAAVVGRSVVVKGQIFSKEDLLIDGDVEGTIELPEHRLTIGPTGRVVVDSVRAREVVVMGSLKGTVDATDKVYIKKDAQLVGDVQTVGIVIEDGAYFKGGIDIRKPVA